MSNSRIARTPSGEETLLNDNQEMTKMGFDTVLQTDLQAIDKGGSEFFEAQRNRTQELRGFEKLQHSFDNVRRSRSFVYISFSIIAIALLCVSTSMQMYRQIKKCPVLVPSPAPENKCCECVCDAVTKSCRNTVSAAANPQTNPLKDRLFYSNYISGVASLLAYVIAFVQIYFAAKEENLWLSVSIAIVVLTAFIRDIWFWTNESDSEQYSLEGIYYLVPLLLAGICALIALVSLWRARNYFGSMLYQRNCVNSTRQRLFRMYQFVDAAQWLELQLVVGFFVMIIWTHHEFDSAQNRRLLLCCIAMFLGDIAAIFAVTFALRREMQKEAIGALLMKFVSAATWVTLGWHYYHCYRNFIEFGKYIRSMFQQDRYLWPKAMGDDSTVTLLDRYMKDCMSPHTLHSNELPFVMATVLISAGVVRLSSCLVFGWLICFFTEKGEIKAMFSKSTRVMDRKDAVVELE